MDSYVRKTDKFEFRLLHKPDAVKLQFVVQEFKKDSLSCYFPAFDSIKTIEDFSRYIGSYELQTELENGGVFGIFGKGEKLFGCLYVHWISFERETASIGFWLSPFARKKGIMAEVLPVFSRFVLEYWHLNRIEVETAVSNKSCISLLEKCGFICEGTARQYGKVCEKFEDYYRYSLIVDDLR